MSISDIGAFLHDRNVDMGAGSWLDGVEPVDELLVGYAKVAGRKRITLQRMRQHLPADRGQHGIGENGVDGAAAALDLCASADNEVNGRGAVVEQHAMLLEH